MLLIALSRRKRDLRFGSLASGPSEVSEPNAFCSRVNVTSESKRRGCSKRLKSLEETERVVSDGKWLVTVMT
jgi:hypothetical protein